MHFDNRRVARGSGGLGMGFTRRVEDLLCVLPVYGLVSEQEIDFQFVRPKNCQECSLGCGSDF
jgi:hypothetical protein